MLYSACMHCIDAAYYYRCHSSVVCLYGRVCVGHTVALSKNVCTDRDAVWGLTYMGPRNHY